ncbi:neuromedin-U receptor 2-like [Ornithodoros turicata]|uniref:neuromedin-U receptor 2-like n=1 Tax=Ornithodoros turicata TaxID=34597 RepID=UPI003139D4DA
MGEFLVPISKHNDSLVAWNGTGVTMTLDDDEAVDVYVTAVLGPKRLELTWLIPLTAVYSIVFLTGIVGNACTCMVIAHNQYMQTATNCYLFNLAVADMLTLLCGMPLELYTLWQQYPWGLGTAVCELRAIVNEATAYTSILTIVTFSTERYIAICHPMRMQQARSKISRAIRNICIIWVLSLVGATPYGIFTRVNYLQDRSGRPILRSAWCGFPFTDPDRSWETLMLCSTFLFFVVPMTLIIVLYVRIAVTLHQTVPRSDTASCRADADRSKVQSRRIVVRMLAAVVIAFFICWAPFHAQRLLFLYVSLYGKWTDSLRTVNQNLFSLAGCFFYFNSTINPILYSIMSNRFRVAFREKLCLGPPTLCCLLTACYACFCCTPPGKADGKRIQHGSSVYRNSSSQGSVRSYVTSYPHNGPRVLHKNNSFPRMRLDARHLSAIPANNDMTWCQNPQYVPVDLCRAGSQSESDIIRTMETSEKSGLERELENALASQLASSGATVQEGDVGCALCSHLLFPNKVPKDQSDVTTVMSTMDTQETLPSRASAMESNF